MSNQQTTHLQGIGKCAAIKASDLKAGIKVVWNHGYTSIVKSVTPSKTGKTVSAELVSDNDGLTRLRTFGANRLVAIA